MTSKTARGIRMAKAGLLINVLLVIVKLVAGIVGNTYALVADATESSTDVFSSLIVWAGLSIAARPAVVLHDDELRRLAAAARDREECAHAELLDVFLFEDVDFEAVALPGFTRLD